MAEGSGRFLVRSYAALRLQWLSVHIETNKQVNQWLICALWVLWQAVNEVTEYEYFYLVASCDLCEGCGELKWIMHMHVEGSILGINDDWFWSASVSFQKVLFERQYNHLAQIPQWTTLERSNLQYPEWRLARNRSPVYYACPRNFGPDQYQVVIVCDLAECYHRTQWWEPHLAHAFSQLFARPKLDYVRDTLTYLEACCLYSKKYFCNCIR